MYEDWHGQLGATPIAPLVLDNRSDDEKSASARLKNAQAAEMEQKNWRRRIAIGWAYFWRFGLTFIVGFILGNAFRVTVW